MESPAEELKVFLRTSEFDEEEYSGIHKQPKHPSWHTPDDWSPGEHGKGILWNDGPDLKTPMSVWSVGGNNDSDRHHLDYDFDMEHGNPFIVGPSGQTQFVHNPGALDERSEKGFRDRGLVPPKSESPRTYEGDYDPYDTSGWKLGKSFKEEESTLSDEDLEREKRRYWEPLVEDAPESTENVQTRDDWTSF